MKLQVQIPATFLLLIVFLTDIKIKLALLNLSISRIFQKRGQDEPLNKVLDLLSSFEEGDLGSV
jgi:hypothetical protein